MSIFKTLYRIGLNLTRWLNKKNHLTGGKRKPPVPLVVNYYEHLLLQPLAIIIGTIMVTYGHRHPFGYFIRTLDFYKAAIPSIAATWAVMRLVVRNTRLLDASHPWQLDWWPGPVKRVLLQAYRGVVRPGFFILGIFTLYFLVRRRPNLIARYFIEDFPLVLLLLIGFNLLCWVYYQLRMDEQLRQWTDWKRYLYKGPPPDFAADTLPGVEITHYDERVKDTVALYEPGETKEEKGTWALHFDGHREVELRSVEELERSLAGSNFCLIRRATLINRAAIAKVCDIEGKTVVVLLGSLSGRAIPVSRRCRSAFLKWWNGSLDNGT